VFEQNAAHLQFSAARGTETHTWTWDASGYPPLDQGRIDLRQMRGRKSRYEGFRVFTRTTLS